MPCGSTKMAKAMKKEYGKKQGMKVYYATKNKDKGFYGKKDCKVQCLF